MTATSQLLACGPGWRVRDIVCTAGPSDPAFEERHEHFCIAVVTAGSFQYRSSLGTALLAPGAILLGNRGTCFECGHEHAIGDRCLAFQFEPEQLEDIVAGVPAAKRFEFARACLPPSLASSRLAAEAEVARGDAGQLEEIAVRLAGAVAALQNGAPPAAVAPSAQDTRRVTRALRLIEAESEQPLTLAGLAREAAMSRYHFLRTFRTLIGMTPHQFLLRTRMHSAATMLRQSDLTIANIAFDAGFGDLSTFNRRFRQVMGASPRAYRAQS